MKKIYSLIAALFVGALAVNAATTVTFDATNDDSGAPTTATANFTLTKGGITINCTGEQTNTGGMLSGGNYRFYSQTPIVVTSTVGDITGITFTTTASYAKVVTGATPGTCAADTTNGGVTWTGSAASVIFTKTGQLRASKIEVTYASADPTAVSDVAATKEVAAVRYYNLAGQQAAEPFEGVNIVKTVFTDGTSATSKVVR